MKKARALAQLSEPPAHTQMKVCHRRAEDGCVHAHNEGACHVLSPRTPPPDVHGMPLWEIKRRLDEMAVDYGEIGSDRPTLEARLMGQYSADRQREIALDEEEDYDDYEPQSWGSWAWGYCSIL